ncbi:MAG: hypothetical protein HOE90_21435 [Bacteriovoracaceae bacterium]|jgi:hypothetical protein|nr:hypothetical protein [Bacteriovoracaceae bacterium]
MGILDRLKRNEYDGFKEFVRSLETTSPFRRKEIMILAMLEDPVYVHWVTVNLLNMEKFLQVGEDFYRMMCKKRENFPNVIARAIRDTKYEKVMMETCLGKNISRLVKEEFEYMGEVPPQEKIGAQYCLFTEFRKLQDEDAVRENPWRLPAQEVILRKDPPGDIDPYELFLESGRVCARGPIKSGMRQGEWKFYYECGALLAEGEYAKGFKSGAWVFNFTNGNILFRGKFKNDERIGVWDYFDFQGNKSEKEYGAKGDD